MVYNNFDNIKNIMENMRMYVDWDKDFYEDKYIYLVFSLIIGF